jgi:hypothetical protein
MNTSHKPKHRLLSILWRTCTEIHTDHREEMGEEKVVEIDEHKSGKRKCNRHHIQGQ